VTLEQGNLRLRVFSQNVRIKGENLIDRFSFYGYLVFLHSIKVEIKNLMDVELCAHKYKNDPVY